MASPAESQALPWFHPITLVLLGLFGLLVLILLFLIPRAPKASANKKSHAVITGGSSGIGKGLAKECAEFGIKNITLFARNKERLESAQKELAAEYPSSNFYIHSVDVCNYEAVENAAKATMKQGGAPTLLFCNAGITSVRSFKDCPASDFEDLMKANYLGTVYATKAFLGDMPSGSTIMITSSMAGAVGVYGYTCYSPVKFALRGFAESLQMEVRRDGITVSLAFPPDTDTPMYKEENRSKPKETFLISEAAGLVTPEAVAKTMLEAALKPVPPFFVYFTFESWMLSSLTSGMSPVHGIFDALSQVLLMGLFRFISLVYLWDFDRIIFKCGKEKMQ